MMNFKHPIEEVIAPHYEKFKSIEGYFFADDSALNFFRTRPANTDSNDVLLKIDEIRDHDLIQLEAQDIMVEHILSLKIDPKLADGDTAIVNRIALLKNYRGKDRNLYAFATRYCNYHRPDYYPIYDRLLEKMLSWFYLRIEGKKFDHSQLFDYTTFKGFMDHFVSNFSLPPLNYFELDKFLWTYGRKVIEDFERLNELHPKRKNK